MTYRLMHRSIVLCSVIYLVTSYVLQYKIGWIPCPLCLMQRFCAWALLLISVLGVVQPRHVLRCWFLVIQYVWIIAGLFFSSRQLWIQSLAAEAAPSCMPNLDVLMQYFSWIDVVKSLFLGTQACTQEHFEVLHLPLAAWSLLFFFGVGVVLAMMVWMRGTHVRS